MGPYAARTLSWRAATSRSTGASMPVSTAHDVARGRDGEARGASARRRPGGGTRVSAAASTSGPRPSSAAGAPRATPTAHAAVRPADVLRGARVLRRDELARQDEHAGALGDRRAVALERGGERSAGAGEGRRGRGRRGRARARSPRSTSTPARASIAASAAPSAPAPMTAARRSGGRPPSHSHCSITFGQMRSVTAAASGALGLLDPREGERPADPDADLVRAEAPAVAHAPPCRSRRRGRRARRSRARAGRRRAWGARARRGGSRVPSANIRTASPRARIAFAVASMSWSPAPRTTGNAPSEFRIQADEAVPEELLLGHVVDGPPQASCRSRTGPGTTGGWSRGSRGPDSGMCSRPMRERRK